MKKYTSKMIILLIGLFPLVPSVAYGRLVVVGIYQNAPLVFMEEDGKVEGISIDILEYIRQKGRLAVGVSFGKLAGMPGASGPTGD